MVRPDAEPTDPATLNEAGQAKLRELQKLSDEEFDATLNTWLAHGARPNLRPLLRTEELVERTQEGLTRLIRAQQAKINQTAHERRVAQGKGRPSGHITQRLNDQQALMTTMTSERATLRPLATEVAARRKEISNRTRAQRIIGELHYPDLRRALRILEAHPRLSNKEVLRRLREGEDEENHP